MTNISFVDFQDLAHVARFSVFNAHPEREDGMLGQLPDGRPVWPVYTDEEDPETGEFVQWVTAEVEPGRDAPNRQPYKFGGGVLRSDWCKGWLNGVEIDPTETRVEGITASENWHLVETAPVGAVFESLDSTGEETSWRKFQDGWVLTRFVEGQ